MCASVHTLECNLPPYQSPPHPTRPHPPTLLDPPLPDPPHPPYQTPPPTLPDPHPPYQTPPTHPTRPPPPTTRPHPPTPHSARPENGTTIRVPARNFSLKQPRTCLLSRLSQRVVQTSRNPECCLVDSTPNFPHSPAASFSSAAVAV